MSEPIVQRQVAAGAAAVTVATVDQAATVLSWGHRHVLIANEVVDTGALERLRTMSEDDGAQVRCFVDSFEGVAAAEGVFAATGATLQVLLDVGTPHGRTGVRTNEQARHLARAVYAAPSVELVGVAGYEGVVPNTRDPPTIAVVDRHCRRVGQVLLDVADQCTVDAPVLSMGGSAFPDRVMEILPTAADQAGAEILLRSGCYVTHDHGVYAAPSRLPGLVPAVTVRAVVLSAPEAGTVVLGAGKRELPHDAGMPVVLSATDAHGTARADCSGTVSTMFDHHTVVTEARGLRVTDVVELGISHPCSVFARWDDYVVTRGGVEVDVWRTAFERRSVH